MEAPIDPDAESPSQAARYWAFISYSQHDKAVAQWLHATLERYRIPRDLVGRRTGGRVIPQRLFPIFRDRDELASASDLSGAIREALRASSALIVVCSPNAAASRWVNEEVRFFKTLGRADRIFPLVVDGAIPGCFPPALRFAVTPAGDLTETPVEPLAADLRPVGDGPAEAPLKLIAGILGVGFDDLKRRDRARQRRQTVWRAAAAVLAVMIAALAYLLLADTGVAIPGGGETRAQLDRYGVSLFRPVPDQATILASAIVARKALSLKVVEGLPKEFEPLNLSGWTTGQIAAASYGDPATRNADIAAIPDLFAAMAKLDLVELNGRLAGWKDGHAYARAETPLWMILGLAVALKRADVLSDATRQRYLEYLETAQRIAEVYHPVVDGGWQVVVHDRPGEYNTYVTAIALHALLELRAAGLCWRGNCEERDRLIRSTTAWLARTFVYGDLNGWRRNPDDDKGPDADITLVAYGAIGQAIVEARVEVPEALRQNAIATLTQLAGRSYFPTGQEYAHTATFTDADGRRQRIALATRLLWYPWGVKAIVQWQRHAREQQLPPETQRALQRALGHVIIGLSDAMLTDMLEERRAGFARAETWYGLNAVR